MPQPVIPSTADSYEPVSDIRPVHCHARHIVLVRRLRHGGWHDPDRYPAHAHDGTRCHDVAWRHADGLERVAGVLVDQARALACGDFIRRRLRDRSVAVVIDPLCAEQADCIASTRFNAFHGSFGATKLSA